MAGFFLFVVVVGGCSPSIVRARRRDFRRSPQLSLTQGPDYRREASIGGQKADPEDVARTGGRARGHAVEEAVGRPVTRLFTADRPDEEPITLERDQACPRMEHPRIAITNICLAAQLSDNRRFDVDMTPYPLIGRM